VSIEALKDIELTLINGTAVRFGDYAGKVVLVVNVASRCGLTPQYEALEAMQKKYGARLYCVGAAIQSVFARAFE
jgi:glutathione peroxidase